MDQSPETPRAASAEVTATAYGDTTCSLFAPADDSQASNVESRHGGGDTFGVSFITDSKNDSLIATSLLAEVAIVTAYGDNCTAFRWMLTDSRRIPLALA